MRFYSKFVVTDAKADDQLFSLLHALVALLFLCQGTTELKAKAICDLYSDLEAIREGPKPQNESLSETYLDIEQVSSIVSTIANVSLILLPLYASDFPSGDKRHYFKLLVDWHHRCPLVIEHLVNELIEDKTQLSATEFIAKAQKLDMFEVLMLREVAKNTEMVDVTVNDRMTIDGSVQLFNLDAEPRATT
jgi:hypothetical protein